MSTAGSVKPQEAVAIPIKRRSFFWKFSDDFQLQSAVFFQWFEVRRGPEIYQVASQSKTWYEEAGASIWWFSESKIISVTFFPK